VLLTVPPYLPLVYYTMGMANLKIADNEVSISEDIPLPKSAKKFHFRFHGCLPGGLHLGDNK